MHERLIIEKLRECRDRIDVWEEVRVSVIETADFLAWQDRVKKWLKAAGLIALDNLRTFNGLLFYAFRPRLPGEGHDEEDQQSFEKDLAYTRHIIDSAIESLELEMHPGSAILSTTGEDEPKNDWAGEARRSIVTALQELASFKGTQDVRLLRERLSRWRDSVERSLEKYFVQEEGKRFRRVASISVANQTISSVIDISRNYLIALAETLEKTPHLVLRVSQSTAPAESPTKAAAKNELVASKRVFIIHGHDETNLLRLEKLLRERYQLEPVILKHEPGQGRTLVEKLEDEIPRCAFAFVLMSPDDHVRVTQAAGDVQEYAQARPNVLFEMGWICGELGRIRMCILFKRGTKIHSDLEGVHRVEFANSVEEVIIGIEKELRAARLLA